MKTLITADVAKTSMTGILRRCLPAIFYAALATTANAQEQVIFNFAFDKTGWTPEQNGFTLVEPNGHVIGTAPFGGSYFKGHGVVFEASPPTKKNPSWFYKVIYRFQGGTTDGESPFDGVTLGNDGVLYGMTEYGGTGDCGVVYQLTPPAAGTKDKWAETVLYDFQFPDSSDGCQPFNSQLLFDASTGSLYGTTSYGGIDYSQGYGTLFRLDPPAQAGGAWTETILHAFTNGSDGANPSGGLSGDPDGGFIYGTSQSGGSANAGVVWAYNTSTAEMTTLYTFQGGTDGAYPNGGVIGPFPTSVQNDAYYLLGTTGGGGGTGATCDGGCGTVFAINVSLSSQGQTVSETQLHAFSETDGAIPISGLTRAAGGAWGTTSEGGPNSSGTLFEVQITSHIDYTTLMYVPIYDFLGSPGDGAGPMTGLGADSAGNLYGMTAAGGENQNAGLDEGAGTLFKFIP